MEELRSVLRFFSVHTVCFAEKRKGKRGRGRSGVLLSPLSKLKWEKDEGEKMTQKKDIWPSITMVKTMIPRVQLRKQDGEHGKRKRKHRIQIFLCRTRKRIGDYSARKSEKKRGKRLLRPIRVRHLFDFCSTVCFPATRNHWESSNETRFKGK